MKKKILESTRVNSSSSWPRTWDHDNPIEDLKKPNSTRVMRLKLPYQRQTKKNHEARFSIKKCWGMGLRKKINKNDPKQNK